MFRDRITEANLLGIPRSEYGPQAETLHMQGAPSASASPATEAMRGQAERALQS